MSQHVGGPDLRASLPGRLPKSSSQASSAKGRSVCRTHDQDWSLLILYELFSFRVTFKRYKGSPKLGRHDAACQQQDPEDAWMPTALVFFLRAGTRHPYISHMTGSLPQRTPRSAAYFRKTFGVHLGNLFLIALPDLQGLHALVTSLLEIVSDTCPV